MTEKVETTLPPCPFCGGTNLVSGGDDKFVGVRCLTCEAVGPNQYGSGHAWGIRAKAPDLGHKGSEMNLRNEDRRRWLAALIERLKKLPSGKTYPLDPVERDLILEAITFARSNAEGVGANDGR